MAKIERVRLGFDLRVPPSEQSGNPSKWNQCLLQDRCSPVSIDPGVWYRTDEVDDFMQDSSWKRVGMEFSDLCNPLGLATDLDRLLEILHNRGVSTTGLLPVCFTTFGTNLIPERARVGPGYFEHQPTESELLRQGWDLRGFDVADLKGLISGLKGCGYKEPIWSELREQFGAGLNEEGLFSSAELASAFAEARGLEVRNHAPFVVIGVLTRYVRA